MRAIDPDIVDVDEVRLRLNKLEDLWKTLEESLTELAIYEEIIEKKIDWELVSHEEKYVALKLNGERIIKERVRSGLAINDLDQTVVALDNVKPWTNENHIHYHSGVTAFGGP